MKKSLAFIVTLLITVIGSYAQDQKPVSTDTYTDAQGRVHVVRNFETIEENNYKKICTTNVDKTESTNSATSSTGLSKEDVMAIIEAYFEQKSKAPETTKEDAETIKLLKKSISLQKASVAGTYVLGFLNLGLSATSTAFSIKNNKLLKGLQAKLSKVGVGTSWALPGTKNNNPTDFGTGSNDSNYSTTMNNTTQTNTTTATQWDLP